MAERVQTNEPARLTGQAAKETYTGVYIMLWLPQAADALKQVFDSLPEETELTPDSELHVTLAVLGEADEQPADEKAVAAVVDEVAQDWPPIHGKVNGIGQFIPDDDEAPRPIVALFDAPLLPALRADLMKRLQALGVQADDQHGFTPHITLGYVPPETPWPEEIPLEPFEVAIDVVKMNWAGHMQHFEFQGDPKDSTYKETDMAETSKATKTDGGREYGPKAFLVVPDPDQPSGWRLRIEEEPGTVTVAQLGRAAAALGPGFRGQKVELEPDQRQAAAKKLVVLYRKHDVADEDIPDYLWEIAGVEKPAEKSVNLGQHAEAVGAGLGKTFPGIDIMAAELFDDHVIARCWGGPGGVPAGGFYKIPYTVTRKAVEGDPNNTEVIDSVTFAPVGEWVRVMPTFMTFKQADGRTRWMKVTSGGFEDRDREIVSTAFLESAVEFADQVKERGPLLLFHVPGARVGECDFQAVVGEPGFLLESGLFDQTEDGEKAARWYEEHPACEMSLSFLYARKSKKVYEPPGVILERSILPPGRAAFSWSGIQIEELEEMSKQITQEKQAFLEEVLGSDRAAAIVAALGEGAEQLKAAGIRWKEAATEPPAGEDTPAESGTPAAPEQMSKGAAAPATPGGGAEGGDPVPQEILLSDEAVQAIAEKAALPLADQLKKLADVEKATNDALGGLTDLRAVLQKLSADVEALKRADDAKIAEKVRDLPRATVKAITRPTQAQPQPTEEAAKESFEEKGKRALYG